VLIGLVELTSTKYFLEHLLVHRARLGLGREVTAQHRVAIGAHGR